MSDGAVSLLQGASGGWIRELPQAQDDGKPWRALGGGERSGIGEHLHRYGMALRWRFGGMQSFI